MGVKAAWGSADIERMTGSVRMLPAALALRRWRFARPPAEMWRLWLPTFALLAVLIAGSAYVLVRAERGARVELQERLALRTGLAARFSESFVVEILERERLQAQRRLAGLRVSDATLKETTAAMGLTASVLLDSRGRAVSVFPSNPTLRGTDLARRYPHLRAAVHGQAAVSPIVRSAVRKEPIVAFAVPFQTPYGRRVFSGGFPIHGTPLAAYLENALPFKGSALYLVDSAGGAFASRGRKAISLDAKTLASLRPGTLEHRGIEYRVERSAVGGAPWSLVSLTPTDELYAPLTGIRRWSIWLLFAGFVASVLGCGFLFLTLMRRNWQLGTIAARDPLTGLLNRRELAGEYRRYARISHEKAVTGAVLMLDLDNFKAVNDTHGHAAGDALLCRVAAVLAESVRNTDVVARIGGDEFAVFLPGADAEGATTVATKVVESFRSSFESRDPSTSITASVGVAVIEPRRGVSLEDALKSADNALYRAKRHGRDGWALAGARLIHNE